jgi:mannose-6-phosphate isomerase-like protein (cupin superfamily)
MTNRKYVVKPEEVVMRKMPGRDWGLIISKDTVNASTMSAGIFQIEQGNETKPCHAHQNEEEVIYFLKGVGKIWIDGKTFDVNAGDTVFFPKRSKHIIKNAGKETLRGIFVFAPPTDPSQYKLHPEIEFPK